MTASMLMARRWLDRLVRPVDGTRRLPALRLLALVAVEAMLLFVRAIASIAVAIAASRIPIRWGGALLIVAIAVASPMFWVTALALLVAIVPLVHSKRPADVG